jgi:hypothetical protein
MQAMAASTPLHLVEARAHEARQLVAQAQSVCSAVALVLQPGSPDGKLDGKDAETCRKALLTASELLSRVASALEPGALTAPAQPPAEANSM